jgi:hypothetical protein
MPPLFYDFPAAPVIVNITGCARGNIDSDTSVFVNTVNCPTAGNIVMTIVGFNFKLPLQIQIGPFAVTTSITLSSQLSPASLFFLLPPGVGQALSIKVHIFCKSNIVFTRQAV